MTGRSAERGPGIGDVARGCAAAAAVRTTQYRYTTETMLYLEYVRQYVMNTCNIYFCRSLTKSMTNHDIKH